MTDLWRYVLTTSNKLAPHSLSEKLTLLVSPNPHWTHSFWWRRARIERGFHESRLCLVRHPEHRPARNRASVFVDWTDEWLGCVYTAVRASRIGIFSWAWFLHLLRQGMDSFLTTIWLPIPFMVLVNEALSLNFHKMSLRVANRGGITQKEFTTWWSSEFWELSLNWLWLAGDMCGQTQGQGCRSPVPAGWGQA